LKEIVIKVECDHICEDGAALTITRLVSATESAVDHVHLRPGEQLAFSTEVNFEEAHEV
jgi:hypothetical protein